MVSVGVSGQAGKRLLAVSAAAVLLVAFLAWRGGDARARLLRTAIDDVPGQPGLMALAESSGRSVFANTCASCHGDGGRGDRNRGIPDLTDRDWLYGSGSPSDTERVVVYGVRSHNPKGWNLSHMPAFTQSKPSPSYAVPPLTPGQLHDVTEFVVQLSGRPADAVATARGARVFANGGSCFDCHSGDAAGDTAIGAPNLTDGTWLYGDGSRVAIARSIARGRAGVMPGFQDRLSPFQLRAAALYAYALSHDHPKPATKAK